MSDRAGDVLFNLFKTKSLENIGFPDHFVSDCGKVFTKKIRGSKSLSQVPRRVSTTSSGGYESVTLRHENKAKTFKVHRLIALCYVHKLRDDQVYVNHIDGNKKNNNSLNLEWCTAVENMRHAHETGLLNRKGSKNSGSKLNEAKVSQIKLFIKMGHRNKELSHLFSVANNTISGIRTNKAWSHVPCGEL